MVDTDTFLTALYVMADDFCKSQLPAGAVPGPKPSLTASEVITLVIFLVIFSQWARFRSDRDFYRYALSRLRPAFPTSPAPQPVQPAYPALLQHPGGFLPPSGGPVARATLHLRSPGQFRRSHQVDQTPGRPNAGALAGCPARLTLAGATDWAGMKASTCCFQSTPRGSLPASA